MTEHDHINWSDEQILEESLRLSEQLRQPYLSPERKAGIESKLSRCAFEAWARTMAELPATPVN